MHHPWVFSNAIREVQGGAEPGEIVSVADYRGNILASGFFNPVSVIPLRIFWWGNQPPPRSYFFNALQKAVSRRILLERDESLNAYRLVFSESDFLPGLIVDRYAEYLVLQTLNPGMERLKGRIAIWLMDLISPRGILEKNDGEVRRREGLSPSSGILAGDLHRDVIEIMENGYRFNVSISTGQKTGFYLDQRENRKMVAQYAEGRSVLDAFSYTGAFSIYTASRGATSLVRVDTSQEALVLGHQNLLLNNLESIPDEVIHGNVFQVLRKFRDANRKFDMIILDPPKLATSRAHRSRAARGYKDINLLAMKLLGPDGILATFSCSGGIDAMIFERILSWSAKDAGREIQILHRMSQGPDHPVLLSFPEAAYLKGFICRVV